VSEQASEYGPASDLREADFVRTCMIPLCSSRSWRSICSQALHWIQRCRLVPEAS